ncbi:hypothetical protein GGR52DRAFT_585255 [Hypoxylon sp. FL1284]|nr:hypothetical protein GGR52DRAFT_585255 [Hypoxylon sp. FL1284]
MKKQESTSTTKSRMSAWKASFFQVLQPTLMVLLTLLGLASAIGHHFYYQGLDGQVVQDAQWPPRFGIALAFFIKLVLLAALDIAYKQQAWVVIRSRGFRLSTLDAIFSQQGTRTQDTTCHNVSFLDFSRENGFGLTTVDDGLRAALSYWNIYPDEPNGKDQRYVYAGPSSDLDRILQLTMLSSTGPLPPPCPCTSIESCTYHTEIAMPAYRCEARDEFGGDNPEGFNKSLLAPSGRLLYLSYSSFAEDIGGQPLTWANMTDSDPEKGVWKELPSLWIGYVTGHYEPHVMECFMYSAEYGYNITFSGGALAGIDRTKADMIQPLLPAGTTKSPDDKDYQQFSGYHAVGFQYRTFLSGNVSLSEDRSYFIDYTSLLQTNILSPLTGLPVAADFGATVGDRFADVFLSMFAADRLHSQFLADGACAAAEAVLVWDYAPFWLVLSYALAVALTLAAVAVGLRGFRNNAWATADAAFSSFVTTSRSADVDALSRGHCLGRWPLPDDIAGARLQFGELAASPDEADGAEPHAAFAFPENVRPLDMGKKYV